MRLARPHRSTRLGINMTPMIDIVFLLIIFFMIVSQISHTADHPVDLPAVGPGGAPLESVNITINIDRDGQLIVADRVRSPRELIQAVRNELERVNHQTDRLRVLVRCDRACPGRFVNDLVGELEAIGIRSLRVSVIEANER